MGGWEKERKRGERGGENGRRERGRREGRERGERRERERGEKREGEGERRERRRVWARKGNQGTQKCAVSDEFLVFYGKGKREGRWWWSGRMPR